MPLFRKKPVVIEAVEWVGFARVKGAIPQRPWPPGWDTSRWYPAAADSWFPNSKSQGLMIPTLEGDMRAELGDWIIKGVKGEFYPCKPDIFAAIYEPADEQPRAAPSTDPASRTEQEKPQ